MYIGFFIIFIPTLSQSYFLRINMRVSRIRTKKSVFLARIVDFFSNEKKNNIISGQQLGGYCYLLGTPIKDLPTLLCLLLTHYYMWPH